jgi:hypothetical protein
MCVFFFFLFFFCRCVTGRQTDKPTDRPTDRVEYAKCVYFIGRMKRDVCVQDRVEHEVCVCVCV